MKRVLHVLRQLNPGGIECWLERLLAAWPRETRPEFHIALECEDFGSLAPRFVQLGAHLHHCPAPHRPAAAAARMRELLRREGPFAAVHCHNHYASPFPLALAMQAGVPRRIAHSHADFRRQKRWRAPWARAALGRLANIRIAVSGAAALDLFGCATGPAIFPCGVDLEAFTQARPRRDVSRFTLAHIGRMVPEKNHRFLLDLISILGGDARLVLLGDGPLRGELERYAIERGIEGRVEFLGNRTDVAETLASADVFVFPSLSEGLGLAAIEAQAAGLPVLLAEHLPPELDLFPARVRRLALDVPIEQWASTVMTLRTTSPLPSEERLAALASSSFSIHANVARLQEIYG